MWSLANMRTLPRLAKPFVSQRRWLPFLLRDQPVLVRILNKNGHFKK